MRRLPRTGFTLIELLVVIAILAVLSALVAAGIGRVRTAQQSRVTAQDATSIQVALDSQWKAVIDQCYTDRKNGKIPTEVINICGGQKEIDRAQALWTYMNLRRELPQTFAEATSSVTVSKAGLPSYSLPPRKTFSSVTGTFTADEQSAILLYLILTEKSNLGVQSNLDGQGKTIPVGAFTAFKDGFSSPIAFVRFYSGAEIQSAPYINAKAGTSKDPMDPQAKLFQWKNQAAPIGDPMTAAIAETAVGARFDGTNKLITVYSAGPDRKFASPDDQDNPFGFRLRRQGNSGD